MIFVLLDIHEVFERLDGKNVLFALLGDFLGPSFDEIVEQSKGFVDVTPIFSMIVQPLPDHLDIMQDISKTGPGKGGMITSS